MLDRRLCPFKLMLPYVIPTRFREQCLTELVFPLVIMPRPKGIRCFTLDISDGQNNNTPVLSTLKLLPNIKIRQLISGLPPGLDGYLVPRTHDINMRRLFLNETFYVGKAGFDWKYAVLDYVYRIDHPRSKKKLWETFETRYTKLSILEPTLPDYVHVMPITPVSSRKELEDEMKKLKEAGYDRARLYAAHGFYRYGQTTWHEHWCFEIAIW